MAKKIRLFLLFSLAVFGCAHGISSGSGDGGAPAAEAEGWSFEHPCDPETLDSDFWNCGECEAICPTADAENCINGMCSCGTDPYGQGPEVCKPGFDCRFGQCIKLEPNGAVCEFDDDCPDGYVCVEGHCSFMACVPEACDGVDNDCDGQIDEASNDMGPLTEWCFDGLSGDQINYIPLAPCALGYHICENGGGWSECFNEIPPVTEQGILACDGEDNDCDGCVDGVVTAGICNSVEPVGFDIVYIIDVSGSMADKVEAVRTATNDFSARFAENEYFRFGIVVLAPGGDLLIDETPLFYQDLTDFNTFQTSLNNMNIVGGSSEPQWDAVYELGSGEMPMTWRDGSVRIIILFSDEEGQTYRANRLLSDVDETAMCASLTHGEVLAVFEDPMFYLNFDDCATLIFPVSGDAEVMRTYLDDNVIQNPCR